VVAGISQQLAAVITEGDVYLAEFVRLVFGVSPIALMLIAITFFRRKQPARILFWMQVIAGIWLTLGLINRLAFAWSRGLFNPKNDNSLDRLQLYFRLSDITWNLETLLFLSFAILFLVQCRRVRNIDTVR
jgi:Mn2+/Fe2+ NRAMP family transporter